jgi:hypothetical protein
VTALRLAVSATPGTLPPAHVAPSAQSPLVTAGITCARAGASTASRTAARAGRIFPRGEGRAEAGGRNLVRGSDKAGKGLTGAKIESKSLPAPS